MTRSETTGIARPLSFDVRQDVVLVAGALALAASCLLTPAGVGAGPVVCPFRIATGLPCPACGSIRSWVALSHGDLAAAWSANPFAIGLFVLTGILIVRRLYTATTRRARPRDIDRILASPATWLLIAIWLVWGTARALNIAGQ